MNPVLSVQSFGTNGSDNAALGGSTIQEQDDFMKLLVAQMRFQDPLNPLQGTEYAAQLAQFSSLEQLRNLGSKLDNALETDLLLARSINNTMAATLIGKEVRAVDEGVQFNGSDEVGIHFDLSSRSSVVKVEILDEEGNIMRSISENDKSTGFQTMTWDGRDKLGNLVPAGDYFVRITASTLDGEQLGVLPVIVGLVDGVKFVDGNPILQVSGRDVPFGAVIQIMEGDNESSNWFDRLIESGQ